MKRLLALGAFLLAPFLHAQSNLDAEKAAQSGTAIHIVFDDSGSMSENKKMEQAKEAFSSWVSNIPEDTKLELTTLNRGTLVPLAPNNKEAVKDQVSQLQPNGGTPLTKTFVRVAQDIKKRKAEVTPYERHILVIFTDGEDTDYSKELVQEAIQGLRKLDIESVGIGFHGQGDYMKATAGKYFDANDSQELLHALQQVTSEIDQNTEVVISPEIEVIMAQQPPPEATAAAPAAQLPPPDNTARNVIFLVFGGIILLLIILGIAAANDF